MHIKELKIENFRGFEQLHLKFPFDGEKPKPVVIFGINGSGKTSILDAIAYLLDSFLDALSPGNRFYLPITNDDRKIGSQITTILSTFQFSKQEKDWYIISEKNNQETSLRTPIMGNHLDKQPFYDAFYNDKDKNLPILRYFPTNRILKKEKSNKPPAYPNINNFNVYYQALNKDLISFNDFVDAFERLENFENQEKLRQEDFQYREPNLEVIRTALERFLSKLPNSNYTNLRVERKQKHKDFSTDAIETNLVIDKNGQTLKISQLSHGEQMLLMMVGDIAHRLTLANVKGDAINGKGIVLIDELELHLHPSWQGLAINALCETFPNIQFIVTTHSPLVINHIKKESIFGLKDNKLVSLPNFNNYGAEIEHVLTLLQGVSEEAIVPSTVSTKLSNYFEHIDNNEIEKAKAIRSDLEKLIDPQHPDILKGNTLIKMKELLGK